MEFIMDKFRKNKETKEDIISIYMVSLEDGIPAMAVETKDEIYTEKLTEGYLIHQCNEFLRSLNVGINIEFNTYVEYDRYLRFLWDSGLRYRMALQDIYSQEAD